MSESSLEGAGSAKHVLWVCPWRLLGKKIPPSNQSVWSQKYLCAEIAITKHSVGESQKFGFLRLNETAIKCPLI